MINDYPKLREIQLAVSKVTGVGMHELISNRKHARIYNARYMYYLMAAECTPKSFVQIGDAIYKDHTTVMAGKQKAKTKLGDVNWLTQLLQVCTELGLPLIA